MKAQKFQQIKETLKYASIAFWWAMTGGVAMIVAVDLAIKVLQAPSTWAGSFAAHFFVIWGVATFAWCAHRGLSKKADE